MSMAAPTDRQAQALARLAPGATAATPLPAVAMPMHMGLDALVTPVDGTGAALIVKTYLPGALAPFTFGTAAEAAARAGELGIAPALTGTDATMQTLLFERLGEGWRMASVADLLSEDRLSEDWLSAVVAALRTWHGSAPLTSSVSPLELFRAHLATAEACPLPVLPATLRMDLAGLTQWVERIAGALDAAGSAKVPLHGEILASNLMLGPDGQVRLLDFDRATMGDPFRDLAALSLEACVDDEDRARLVTLYTGQPASAADMARLKLLGMLEDACWALWALIGETVPERRGPELYKYATNRLIRFRLCLSSYDMARLLREV